MLPLAISLALLSTQAPPKAAAPPASGPLARVVVLGASFSEGFGLERDVGARTTFADIVDAAIVVEHPTVGAHTDTLLFLDPAKAGPLLAEHAKAAKPTLVVAIDYLFWFGYGEAASDDARLAKLETGLALVGGFQCPVVVGDFADMSPALKVDPAVAMVALAPQQVPSPAALTRLNDRLTQWAAEHPNVVVVPCADFLKRLRASEEIRLRGNTWHKGAIEFLLQKDELHTTLEGSIATWIFAADRLVKQRPEFPASAFDWSARSIYKRVYAKKEPERAQHAQQRIEELKKANPIPPPEPAPTQKGARKP